MTCSCARPKNPALGRIGVVKHHDRGAAWLQNAMHFVDRSWQIARVMQATETDDVVELFVLKRRFKNASRLRFSRQPTLPKTIIYDRRRAFRDIEACQICARSGNTLRNASHSKPNF